MNGKYAERKENTYVYDCKRSSSVPTKKAYIIKEHCAGDQNCGFVGLVPFWSQCKIEPSVA